MNALEILSRYLKDDTLLYNIVYTHSRSVANKALTVAYNHPELQANLNFLEQASLIHDIGVFKTNAPSIECFGTYPYICHGYLGREIIESEGFPEHALVCERHTGTGLSKNEIETRCLPIPFRNMMPVSVEETIICFSDLFFSKTNLENERSVSSVRSGLEKYGKEGVIKFDEWCSLFL